MVEEHSPPLLVERPPSGQTAGWFREDRDPNDFQKPEAVLPPLFSWEGRFHLLTNKFPLLVVKGVYHYIYGHPPKADLSSLVLEGVNSTLCASFLQMPEHTVKYSVVVGSLPSIYDSTCWKGNTAKTESVFRFESGFV